MCEYIQVEIHPTFTSNSALCFMAMVKTSPRVNGRYT